LAGSWLLRVSYLGVRAIREGAGGWPGSCWSRSCPAGRVLVGEVTDRDRLVAVGA